ncbi:MAG: hypothetical protein Tsb0014_19040 [Pleurocapsa sp.]
MEVLTIVLSGLLSLLSSGGIILDSLAGKTISSQVSQVEQQQVRLDNVPSYQVVGGKIQKIRVATRGVRLKQGLRIEAFELETDPVNLDRSQLNFRSLKELRKSLKDPLQGAVRLRLTETDLNQGLQSPEIQKPLQDSLNRLVARKAGSTNIAYELRDLRLELHSDNFVVLQFKLNRAGIPSDRDSELVIALKLKIEVSNGKTIALVDPQGTVNNRPMSSRLLQGFASGISDRLDLGNLETKGIVARFLQLEINEDRIELASFVRMETKSSDLSSSKL